MGKGKHGKSWTRGSTERDWHTEEDQKVAGGLWGFLSQKSFSAMQEGSSSRAGLGGSSSNLLLQVHTVKTTIILAILEHILLQ